MEKKISVVCTVFNDQSEIKTLLDDINMQEIQPSEIVIADGGSKDDTIKIISDYKENSKINIKLIQGKRLNISQGFNEAIKKSENDIIVIMSTGNRYDRKFIKKLNEKYEETKADIVFAPIRGDDSVKFSKIYNKTFLNGKYGSRIPSNHGVLVKRSVFERIGLFYEKFIYAGEDAEFFDRARTSMLNIECAEDSILEWKVPNDLKSFKKQINAYTIAKMQIESYSILKKYKRNYCIILLLILGLLSIVLKQYYIGLILLMIYIFLVVYKGLKIGIREYAFANYRKWLEIKTILCNFNILNKKYNVDKDLIEKL